MAQALETPDADFDAGMTYEAPTTFQEMYDFFLAGITDDMFMELTKEDTEELLEEILIAALPNFEFPRWKDPFNIDLQNKKFNTTLTIEEKMIIRQYMISEWIGYQLANIDLVRQKYSGSDFKFTSQAAHMKQLITLKKNMSKKVCTFSACIAADVQIQMGIYIPLLERLWSVHHGGFSR